MAPSHGLAFTISLFIICSPFLVPAALTLALAVAGFLPSTVVGPINVKIKRWRMWFPHQEGLTSNRTALHRRDLPRTLKSQPSQKNDAPSPLSFNFVLPKSTGSKSMALGFVSRSGLYWASLRSKG
ncbi:hypothetical protein RHGRI_005045 [Rhododendron griersonianum]|uniref:Uncharacterized protein n=1 Tax=Rhododendron griersonianum TaxID=479676 RepID=A0AAV6LAR4_9ERIC|nr:hypothetical protein RHGRI_005045 [Rhododendron griersonianum]